MPSTDRRRLSMAAALPLLGAACNGTTSYLDATGTTGRAEAHLGRWLTVVSLAVVAAVCLAIVAGIMRHRGEAEQPERREIASGLRWIYIGIAGTVIVLILTFAGTMVTLDAASHPPSEPAITMDVTGHQWWWEVRYSQAGHPEFGFVTANEVHLPVGVPVRVRLHAADVIHSFWMPQIAGKTDVIPGQVNEMWVEAREASTSLGMCGEYCGLQHAHMTMPVVAESPAAFDAWAASRRAGASPVTGTLAEGQAVFARSCGACHAVAGTLALGRVGPDLTHLASRPFIGAGTLPNTPANLMGWITNAPLLKEGARMPAIPLDAGQLQSVVAYLGSLR